MHGYWRNDNLEKESSMTIRTYYTSPKSHKRDRPTAKAITDHRLRAGREVNLQGQHYVIRLVPRGSLPPARTIIAGDL